MRTPLPTEARLGAPITTVSARVIPATRRYLAVTVRAGDNVGTGLTWLPGVGYRALLAFVDEMGAAIVGRPADPEQRWADLADHCPSPVLAALDLALWDLVARARGTSVAALHGGHRTPLPAFAGGPNLHLDTDALRAAAHRWVAAGYGGAQVEVGSADPARDVERVAAVRAVLGRDRRLALDAGQRWDLFTAVEVLRAVERYEPRWVEDPLRDDDLGTLMALRGSTRTPIAIGRTYSTVHRFAEARRFGGVGVFRPDLARLGGLTPFLRLARDSRVTPVVPRFPMELAAQIATVLPEPTWIEAEGFPIPGTSPVTCANGTITLDEAPGFGLTLP